MKWPEPEPDLSPISTAKECGSANLDFSRYSARSLVDFEICFAY